MGVEQAYYRISTEEFERLRSDPASADHFFGLNLEEDEELMAHLDARDASGCYLSIGKDWQGIHFLLTGEVTHPGESKAPPPLADAVMGGTETEWEATYGMVRFLAPGDVREVAEALERIAPEDLRSRLDPDLFNRHEIYPARKGWDRDEVESLLDLYSQVAAFYAEAARQGQVVLLESQ